MSTKNFMKYQQKLWNFSKNCVNDINNDEMFFKGKVWLWKVHKNYEISR